MLRGLSDSLRNLAAAIGVRRSGQAGSASRDGADRPERFDRLILLLMLAALVVIWSVSAAYMLAQRHRIVERVQGQLALTAATLADLNELAEQAAGASPEARDARRAAAIWRALLQYPTARIWVESGGVVTAGQPPAAGSRALIAAREKRAHFTVHAALPKADALADWRRVTWEGGGVLVAISAVFLLLTRGLTRAMRSRAAAERAAAAAQERNLQLARYRRELEATVAQRTAELRDTNARLQSELGERLAAEAALRQHDGLLKSVTGSAGELLGSHSFEEAVPSVLALIGRTLSVSRVQLETRGGEGGGRPRSAVCHEWCAAGIVPLRENPAFRDLDIAAAYPEGAAAGETNSFFIDDIAEPYRGLFAAAGMRSFLQIPIAVDGMAWGRLNFIDSAAVRRVWSWAETDTLHTLAELIGTAITRARYVRELADANMIVQNSPTILYRLRGEPSLPLIYVSHNITKFGHDPASLVGSPNWSQTLIDPQDRAKVGAAMARVLDKGAQASAIEFRLVTGDGGRRWVENRYTPVRDATGRLVEIEGIIIDITERKAAEERIARLARTDALTGLANRATFIERLRQSFAATGRGASPFAVLYLDLDHFKNVNDTLGHTAGDRLLQEVAKRLEAGTRESDLVARLGGDEFAVLQTEISEPASAGTLAAHLKDAIARPFRIAGNELHVTASIGISPFAAGIEGADAMLTQADLALYRAKDEGRNRYCFHSPELDQEMRQRIIIAEDLQNALVHSEMAVYYQPQIDLISGQIVGMEALARWNHPSRGLLYPADFIPVAEKTGAIAALGRWVLNEACRQMKLWREAGVAPPVIAVNLSLSELRSGRDLVRDVAAVIAKWGLAPGQIEFDVTEATLAHVTWTQNDVLAELHNLGVRIAIDDFGTEYSSFDYLRKYRVNHLKLAQSFIRKAVDDPGRAATIRAIISLARELGIDVIAEGVETREQRNFLIETGSGQAQGFYFSKPVDAAAAGGLLRQGHIGPKDRRGGLPPAEG